MSEHLTRSQKRKMESQKNDIISLLKTGEGRRVLYRIIEKCGVYRSEIGTVDEVMFHQGQRAIGLFIIGAMIEADPHAYANLLAEHVKYNLNNPDTDTE